MSQSIDKKVTIKIDIPEVLYSRIKEDAQQRGLSIRAYAVRRLSDDTVGVEELRSEISKALPAYYNRVNEVGNKELQHFFRNFGGALCQL